MYSVNYHRASSVADAAKLAGQGDAKFLSGGMTLIPAMKARLASPSDLVDLGHIAALKGITVSGETSHHWCWHHRMPTSPMTRS